MSTPRSLSIQRIHNFSTSVSYHEARYPIDSSRNRRGPHLGSQGSVSSAQPRRGLSARAATISPASTAGSCSPRSPSRRFSNPPMSEGREYKVVPITTPTTVSTPYVPGTGQTCTHQHTHSQNSYCRVGPGRNTVLRIDYNSSTPNSTGVRSGMSDGSMKPLATMDGIVLTKI